MAFEVKVPSAYRDVWYAGGEVNVISKGPRPEVTYTHFSIFKIRGPSLVQRNIINKIGHQTTRPHLVTTFAMSVSSMALPVMSWYNTTVARVIGLCATVVAMAGGGYRIAKRTRTI